MPRKGTYRLPLRPCVPPLGVLFLANRAATPQDPQDPQNPQVPQNPTDISGISGSYEAIFA